MYTLEQKEQFIKDIAQEIKSPAVRIACKPGDLIHIHSRNGCYRVHASNQYGFVIMINRKPTIKPWSDFKCLKGDTKRNQERLLLMLTLLKLTKDLRGED
jgi:hypothetical protein